MKTYAVLGPDCYFRNNKTYENGKVDSLGLNAVKKNIGQHFLQVKVVTDSIWYKKVSGRICLSPLGGELGSSKDCHF